jgi:hypothetical protein
VKAPLKATPRLWRALLMPCANASWVTRRSKSHFHTSFRKRKQT